MKLHIMGNNSQPQPVGRQIQIFLAGMVWVLALYSVRNANLFCNWSFEFGMCIIILHACICVLRALYMCVYGFRYQKDAGNFVMILTKAVVLQSFAVVAALRKGTL